MDWKRLISEIFGKETRLVFPRFYMSKKNQVTQLIMDKSGKELNIIAKFFVWGNAAIEWDILTRASKAGLDVPKPLHLYENIIFMEYIPGTTLLTIHDSRSVRLPVELLAAWTARFHRTFKNGDLTILKGDGMFPNFIWQKENNRLYGVDFEESTEGREITDVADMAVSLLMSGDSFSEDSKRETEIFLKLYKEINPVEFDGDEFRNLLIYNLERRIMFVPQFREKIEVYINEVKSGRN